MTPGGTRTRILIGAGSFADAESAIRLAERIVASLPAELGGVLVDEGLMADIVHLPGQRVVSTGGTLLVPPSIRQIRSLMEADARAFRHRLSAIARTRTVQWSFEQRSGDLIRGLCEAARGWDILLLGYREMHKRSGPVVLVTSAPAGSPRAEALATDLAGLLKAGVVVLAVSPDDGAPKAPPDQDVLARLSRINAAAVVIDMAASPMRTEDHLRQLLDAARCPVLVLGAAPTQDFAPSEGA